MMFYTGDLFPDWKGNLFVGSMSAEHGHKLVRLVLNGDASSPRRSCWRIEKDESASCGRHRIDRST